MRIKSNMRFALNSKEFEKHLNYQIQKLLIFPVGYNSALSKPGAKPIVQIYKELGNSGYCDEQGAIFSFYEEQGYCELYTFSYGGMCGFEFDTEDVLESEDMKESERNDLALANYIITVLETLHAAGILGDELDEQETL